MSTNTSKRRAYKIKEKLRALDQIKAGKSVAKVAHEMGISSSTVRSWTKEEDKYRTMNGTLDVSCGLHRKHLRPATYSLMESVLLQWYKEQRSYGVEVTGPILQEQAEIFARQIHGPDSGFKCSNGWLYRFRARHNITVGKMRNNPKPDESSDEEMTEMDTSMVPNPVNEKLNDITGRLLEESYSDDQIYTCAAMGFCYKMLPHELDDCEDDEQKARAMRERNDRITLLLCVNKSGRHKIKPFMIGRRSSPQCFEKVNMNCFPVEYASNEAGWIDPEVFEAWFCNSFVPSVKQHLISMKKYPKAALLVENCEAYTAVNGLVSADGDIKVHLVKAICKENPLPLQQSILSNLKYNIRETLLDPTNNEVKPDAERISLLDLKEIGYLLSQVWEAVPCCLIQQCWSRSVQSSAIKQPSADAVQYIDETKIKDDKFKSKRVRHNEINKWATIDDMCPYYMMKVELRENEIGVGMIFKQEVVSDDEESPSNKLYEVAGMFIKPEVTETTGSTDKDDDKIAEPPVCVTEAIEHLTKSLRWLECQDTDTEKIMQLRNILDFAKARAEFLIEMADAF